MEIIRDPKKHPLTAPLHDPLTQPLPEPEVETRMVPEQIVLEKPPMSDRQRSWLTILALGMFIAGVYLIFPTGNNEVETVTQFVPRETSVAASAAPASEEEVDLRQMVAWEEQRLAQLRSAFDQVQARENSADFVKTQIATINTRVREIDGQLGELASENTTIEEDHQAFQRQQKIDENSTTISVESQIQEIDAALFELNAQRRNFAGSQPATAAAAPTASLADYDNEIARLELQKSQLIAAQRNNQRAFQNESLAGQQEAQDMKIEVRTGRQNLQREKKDLLANLEYWREQEMLAGNEDLRSKRLARLQLQMSEQDKRIAELRLQLAGE